MDRKCYIRLKHPEADVAACSYNGGRDDGGMASHTTSTQGVARREAMTQYIQNRLVELEHSGAEYLFPGREFGRGVAYVQLASVFHILWDAQEKFIDG